MSVGSGRASAYALEALMAGKLIVLATVAIVVGWLIARPPRIEIRLARHAGTDGET